MNTFAHHCQGKASPQQGAATASDGKLEAARAAACGGLASPMRGVCGRPGGGPTVVPGTCDQSGGIQELLVWWKGDRPSFGTGATPTPLPSQWVTGIYKTSLAIWDRSVFGWSNSSSPQRV